MSEVSLELENEFRVKTEWFVFTLGFHHYENAFINVLPP